MDAPTFRTIFPEFLDTTAYPDASVTFWLGIAANFINVDRWGTLADLGTALFTAHYLSVGRQAAKSGAAGGTPGAATGIATSKSVADVSVSYDAALASVKDGGHWNLTTYGTRYLELVGMFGAGGVQL